MEREADQFQWSSLTQKWCAALSTIFSRNSSINKLSQRIPTALCVCVCVYLEMHVHLFAWVLESVSFQPLYVLGVCVSQCVYMWCLYHWACGWCAYETKACLFMRMCVYLVRCDCSTLRRCVYKSLQGHVVITMFGECFFITTTHVVTTGPKAIVQLRHNHCI